MPHIYPQNCPFLFDDLLPHLIHPSLDRLRSPSQTASRSNQPFCRITPSGQTDRQTRQAVTWDWRQVCTLSRLRLIVSDAANNVLVSKVNGSPPKELKWDQSITCHRAEVTFPPLPQPIKTALDLATPAGCKAELTQLVWLHTEMVYQPEDGHPSQYKPGST